jgi:hypothetical protein
MFVTCLVISGSSDSDIQTRDSRAIRAVTWHLIRIFTTIIYWQGSHAHGPRYHVELVEDKSTKLICGEVDDEIQVELPQIGEVR